MSFILDAIAKSERERQQQEIPDARILATPVSDGQRPRRILPYYLPGALLLVVIVLLIWMQTDRSPFNRDLQSENENSEPAVMDQVESPNETSPVEMSDSSAGKNQVAEIPEATTQIVRAKTSIPNPDINRAPLTRKPPVLDQSRTETKDPGPTLIEGSRAASGSKIDSTATANMTHTGNDSVRSVPVESNSRSGITAPEQLAKQTDVEIKAQPATRKITRLSDLPANVRRDLPSVAFTGHLYSKNVNLSYVMVDGGRSVIAGQQIADELYLHQVTPTGAIVDFRGYLIETGILQNWSLK